MMNSRGSKAGEGARPCRPVRSALQGSSGLAYIASHWLRTWKKTALKPAACN
jgi:hypothetical protein